MMKWILTMAAALFAVTAQAEVPYITGGVGKAERDMIIAKKSDYNLEVKVALKTGHYLGDVKITIQDKSGAEVLNATTDGPLFYAKLEPGTYAVTAHYEAQQMKQSVTIANATFMRELIFRFDGNEEIIKDE